LEPLSLTLQEPAKTACATSSAVLRQVPPTQLQPNVAALWQQFHPSLYQTISTVGGPQTSKSVQVAQAMIRAKTVAAAQQVAWVVGMRQSRAWIKHEPMESRGRILSS